MDERDWAALGERLAAGRRVPCDDEPMPSLGEGNSMSVGAGSCELLFRCDMLQKRVGQPGVVLSRRAAWRTMGCDDDADDFESLREMGTRWDELKLQEPVVILDASTDVPPAGDDVFVRFGQSDVLVPPGATATGSILRISPLHHLLTGCLSFVAGSRRQSKAVKEVVQRKTVDIFPIIWATS